jgi:hypothetical protein
MMSARNRGEMGERRAVLRKFQQPYSSLLAPPSPIGCSSPGYFCNIYLQPAPIGLKVGQSCALRRNEHVVENFFA